mgnify:FL=1
MTDHYYASSIADWRVNISGADIIIEMMQQGYPFSVWHVAMPIDAEYQIVAYRPQVPDELLTHVGFWDWDDLVDTEA